MQNDSYWYRARNDVGGALHSKREVERLTGDVANHFPRGVGFQGFYYAKRTNRDGDLVPMRISAGTAPTAVKAWALAENACKARDYWCSFEAGLVFCCLPAPEKSIDIGSISARVSQM